MDTFPVYLEIGHKRTFAGALDWPGWCRSGRDTDSALQALLDYGSRYARVVRPARLGFKPPRDTSVFKIKEQLTGDATTDFGAPGIAPAWDTKPLDEAELKRWLAILKACWRALESAREAATGRELRKGPRGGGRPLAGVVGHVLDSDQSYLSQIGRKLDKEAVTDLELRWQAIAAGVRASARGEIPVRGPRGGLRWSPRYFVRRSAWHILDHAWELEDRIL